MHAAIFCLATLFSGCDDCCAPCAAERYCCPECCQELCKVCRAECGKKEVPKVKFRVECEDFCIPGPSRQLCCTDACGHCQKCLSPTCGKVRTRKKLVKIEEKEEIAAAKCVVELACPCCHVRYKMPSMDGDQKPAEKKAGEKKDSDKKLSESPKVKTASRSSRPPARF